MVKAITKKDEKFGHLVLSSRKFVKYYLETQNMAEAWMKSHHVKNKTIATINACRFLRNHPEVKIALYESMGLDEQTIIKTLKGALKANRQQIYKGRVYNFKDHYARMKALELIKKFKGEETTMVSPGALNQLNVVIVEDRNKSKFEVVEGELS